jgi:hypothetical protein
MDLNTQVRRLEQQLSAFEKLHAKELRELQEKLAAYMRIQAEEVRLLHEQLDELKRAVEAQTATHVPPVHPTNSKEVSL